MNQGTRSGLLLLFAALAACAAEDSPSHDDDDDAWSESGKADDPNAGGVASTHASDVRLLDGYNKLLDTTADRCLEPSDDTPAYTVGAIEKPFDMYFISSKQDLANTLGIDVGLKIKYGSTSIGPSVSFVDSFRQSRSAVHLLVAARASYRVTNARSVRLAADALEWLRNEPRLFLHRCGNFFVNGVEHEAQLFVMIRLDALTDQAARAINADLGIGAVTSAIGLDATVKVKLERLASRSDVAVETHVLDRGFLVDGGIAGVLSSLLSSGISAETFAKIEQVRAAMLASVNADVCRDGGQGLASCPASGPGYPENQIRNVVPVKIDLRHYSRATNAPIGGPGSPYETNRHVLERANMYLRTLSKLSMRIDDVARDEIGAFLAASTARKATFGIAPPAAPVHDVEKLVTIAGAARDRFDDTRGDSVAGKLGAAISTCWAAALEGAFEACALPDNASPATAPEAVAVEAALAEYAATSRIVPLRFSSQGVLGYAGAKEACSRIAMRLPTLTEAQRLSIPIGHAMLPRTNEDRLRFAAWHGDKAKCNGDDAPAFSNAPSGMPGPICTVDNWWSPHPTTTLCVPPSGPFDALAKP